MLDTLGQIILNFNKIKKKRSIKPKKVRIYKRKDFNLTSLKKLNHNLKNNMIEKYLKKKKLRDRKVVLIEQSWIR